MRALSADAAVPPKPKKPVSGYLAYHLEVRKELEAAGRKLSIGDAAKEVAARWKNLSDEQKKVRARAGPPETSSGGRFAYLASYPAKAHVSSVGTGPPTSCTVSATGVRPHYRGASRRA